MAEINTVNLTMLQGATYTESINYKSDGVSTDDLSSGYTARMHIRETIGTATPTAEFVSAGETPAFPGQPQGVITLAATSPNIVLSMSATTTDDLDTAVFTDFVGVYDLELINTGSGQVDRIMQGTFTIAKEVTRP